MKKIILIASIAILGFTSCQDKLNPVPSNAVSDEQIFSSVEAASTALNSGMAYVRHYFNLTLDTIGSELMGEEAILSPGSYGIPTYSWLQYAYSYSQVPEDGPWYMGYANYIWPNAYRGIDVANSIIARMEEAEDEAGKENLLGQAYALRGYFHLRLIRLFATTYSTNPEAPGVILRTTPADAAVEHQGRAKLSEVYAQILSDLEYGRQHCSASDISFFTPRSCALFQARAYLDMHDYTNAKKYAELAANNTFDGSNLMSQADYQAGFCDPNDEWLMTCASTETTSNYYASVPSFYYLAKSAVSADANGKANPNDLEYLETPAEGDYFEEPLYGYSTVRWTNTFRNSFEDGDCRKLFPFYFYEADGWFTSKFIHRDGALGVADFPLARIAEAYLIEAEALTLGGGNGKSVLNALQVARGATPTDGSIESIYKERRKELYGEGFALADIKRLHRSLDRSDPEHWGDVRSLPADSPRFMLPIPEYEMLYNKALTAADQNEFWRK